MKPIATARLIMHGVILALLTACRFSSFEHVDLQPILLQSGDLPAILVAGANGPIETSDDFKYDVAYQQHIASQSGTEVGEVQVYLFHTAADRDKMYDLLSLSETQEGIVPYETPLIGDMILARQSTPQSGNFSINLTFKRCYAVANIWLNTTEDFKVQENDVVVYAQKLDERLKRIACP